ncbi:hypothetical protein C5167_007083 [Papaver somniferum]|uniref:Uncharacterized protein n=1 Tax=Papaver somniferum TaxID=3469 RepID=A0A4Y7JF63_PAPSO|nr:hypothetical protein C5167_007083 [Papaver somniferum]
MKSGLWGLVLLELSPTMQRHSPKHRNLGLTSRGFNLNLSEGERKSLITDPESVLFTRTRTSTTPLSTVLLFVSPTKTFLLSSFLLPLLKKRGVSKKLMLPAKEIARMSCCCRVVEMDFGDVLLMGLLVAAVEGEHEMVCSVQLVMCGVFFQEMYIGHNVYYLEVDLQSDNEKYLTLFKKTGWWVNAVVNAMEERILLILQLEERMWVKMLIRLHNAGKKDKIMLSL